MKFIATLIFIVIIYLSNTPDLEVLNFRTWFNNANYENIKLTDIFSENSLFFEPWSHDVSLDFYFHKAAHFIFYGLLGILLLSKNSSYKTFLTKLALILLFALSDEIHQYFVVGRSGRLIDVLFDWASIVITTTLFKSLSKFKLETTTNTKKRTV